MKHKLQKYHVQFQSTPREEVNNHKIKPILIESCFNPHPREEVNYN